MHPTTSAPVTIKLAPANIVNLGPAAIGTSLLDSSKTGEAEFYKEAERIIASFNFQNQPVPGQGFLPSPSLVKFLRAGVGRRTDNPHDYVLRCHRGRVDAYLKQAHAAPVEGAALVVYTRMAYMVDPDVVADATEFSRVVSLPDATHFLIAVLAFAGPASPLSPYRFVANLAGGNHEAATWSPEVIASKAASIVEYDRTWCVVAGEGQ